MAKTIGTAEEIEILHDKCGKPVAKDIGGVLHVQCVRRGCKEWVPLSGYFKSGEYRPVIDLLKSGDLLMDDALRLADPCNRYRGIEGLFVVGRRELDLLFRTEVCPYGPKKASYIQPVYNPLNLKQGWIPYVPITEELDEWIRSEKWRTDEKWRTRAALVLAPHSVGGIPTSLIGQNRLLGAGRDESEDREGRVSAARPYGIIRGNVFWGPSQSEECWANEPASADWRWAFIYESPVCIMSKKWAQQQEVAMHYGMPIATAALDAWCSNMVRAVYDVPFRRHVFSRTCTDDRGTRIQVDTGYKHVSICYDFEDRAEKAWTASLEGAPKSGI